MVNFAFCSAFAFLLSVAGNTLAAQKAHFHSAATVGETVTSKDSIPDLAANSTIRTKQSGAWHSADTWMQARVPRAGDVVMIEEGHMVTYAGLSDRSISAIGVKGTLKFDNQPSLLKVGDFLIYRSGRVHAGTTDAPLSKLEIVIANKPIESTADPLEFGTGIVAFGEVRMHGEPKRTWTRLAQELRAGQSEILLSEDPEGWKPGDRLVIPDSRQQSIVGTKSTLRHEWVALQLEEATVSSINGRVVVLAAPLRFDHLGARGTAGMLIALPHVGNLSRSITVRSESATQNRAHILFTERATINIRYATFQDLGRTTAAPLSSSNKIGRYPIHFHHLMGPRNLSNEGHQYAFVGNVVHDCRKWCVAIHNSHWGRITDNVIVGADGAGIVAEQGNERENEIDRNFIVKVGPTITTFYRPIYGGVRANFSDLGWEGSCLWFSGNDNYVRNNVSANCAYAGVMYNGRAAGGFGHHHPLVPRFRGADIAIQSEWYDYKKPARAAPPIVDSHGNEVYASAVGTWVGFSGSAGTIRDALHWHISQHGIYAARNASVIFNDITLINDPSVSASSHYASRGLYLPATTYNSGQMQFSNVRIEGYSIGIFLPGNRAPLSGKLWPGIDATTMELDDMVLRNYVNVADTSANTVPKSTIFRNSLFEPAGAKPHAPLTTKVRMPTIPMDFMGYLEANGRNANVAMPSRLLSYNHNKTSQDVEFFFPQQARDFVMSDRIYPSGSGTRPQHANCPTAGLTNEQCMVQHGIATLGQLAPCTKARTEVDGFLCELR